MKLVLKLLVGAGLSASLIYFMKASRMRKYRSLLRKTTHEGLHESRKALHHAIAEIEDQAEELLGASRVILKKIRKSL